VWISRSWIGQPKKILILAIFLWSIEHYDRVEASSFLNGYSGYSQNFIAPEDGYKTTFIID
jgi:hypothetical protein